MTRRLFTTICGAVLLSGVVAAQSRGSTADPVTGTWTGDLVPQGGDRTVAVTLELKHDGKGSVTGTVAGLPNPGDIKKGTFDRKSGALVLQLGRADSPSVLITLDGTLAKGAAEGRMSGEAGPGTFKLVKRK